METIYTPVTLTDLIRRTFAGRFAFVWVKGEIGSLVRASTGHIYFSLKDAQAQIQCVWFANRQRRAGETFDPLTGEVYDKPRASIAQALSNGMEVLCAGSIDAYAPRSQYQLNIEIVQPAGTGLLAAEFEARKARYEAAGYFSNARKRPLPSLPSRVAVVASEGGAAIHDFLKLSRERGLSSVIRLYPAPAQGQGASLRMAEIIELINQQNWAEVIVLIRGGGSLEDLWAYNEDVLVEAIYNSTIPIVAGVGHEIDFTLADLTADVRAATPSHAGQLLWPLHKDLWQRLDFLDIGHENAMERLMQRKTEALQRRFEALSWLSPLGKLERLELALSTYLAKLELGVDRWLENLHRHCEDKERSLFVFSPLLPRIEKQALHIDSMQERLGQLLDVRLLTFSANLEKSEAALGQLNPVAPLKRGYALLLSGGEVIHSGKQINAGDHVDALMADAFLGLSVNEKKSVDFEQVENILYQAKKKDHETNS